MNADKVLIEKGKDIISNAQLIVIKFLARRCRNFSYAKNKSIQKYLNASIRFQQRNPHNLVYLQF